MNEMNRVMQGKHDRMSERIKRRLRQAGIVVVSMGVENLRDHPRWEVNTPGRAYLSHLPDLLADHAGQTVVVDAKTTFRTETGNLSIDLFSYAHLLTAARLWGLDVFVYTPRFGAVNVLHLDPFQVNVPPKWGGEMFTLAQRIAGWAAKRCRIQRVPTGGSNDPYVLFRFIDTDYGTPLVPVARLDEIFPSARFDWDGSHDSAGENAPYWAALEDGFRP